MESRPHQRIAIELPLSALKRGIANIIAQSTPKDKSMYFLASKLTFMDVDFVARVENRNRTSVIQFKGNGWTMVSCGTVLSSTRVNRSEQIGRLANWSQLVESGLRF